MKLDGDGSGDFWVYNSGRMTHDSATLSMLKDINKSSNRPLHHRRRDKRHEPQRWPHHLTPARVTSCATLHAYWNTYSNHLQSSVSITNTNKNQMS